MNDKNLKYLGLVKWFGDKQRNRDYGFILHDRLGEIYFKSRNVTRLESTKDIASNDSVIFKIKKSEAIDVVVLKNVKDLSTVLNPLELEYIFSDFLSMFFSGDRPLVLHSYRNLLSIEIQKLFKKIPNNQKKGLVIIFKDFISNVIVDYKVGLRLAFIANVLFKDEKEKIVTNILGFLDKEAEYQFWLKNYYNHIDIDILSEKVISDIRERSKIFERCEDKTKNQVFFKLLFDLGYVDSDQKISKAIYVLDLCRKYYAEGYSNISNKLIENSPTYIRLSFWLKEYTEYFNFDEFVNYTITLSVEEQKLFFKKVFKLIHEKRINLKLKDLQRIMSADIDLHQNLGLSEKEVDELDFSICIVLQIIQDLSNNKVTKRQTIFEIIANKIKKPKNLLQIEGFFNKCSGRSIAVLNPISDIIEEEANKKVEIKKLNKKPRYAVFCDGRKSNSRCIKTDLEFWWCENNKCYNPERKLQTSENWKDYSLIDLLNILDIDFAERDYEVVLNVINKTNRFLDHLSCKECGAILYPKGKTNFSFWGVSEFLCKNVNCSKQNEEVYISHCLNGKCGEIIDSRDCVKCKPAEFEECGWYVCNFCNACCSSEKLNNRKWVHENILKKDYTCHTKGHKDLGEIACNKCGVSMDNIEFSQVDYERTLQWFIDNKEDNSFITNSGRRADGKWWFLFVIDTLNHDQYREKLANLLKLGFEIPDYDLTNKTNQLISEPYSMHAGTNVLSCSNCNHMIKIKGNKNMRFTMISYHNKFFIGE